MPGDLLFVYGKLRQGNANAMAGSLHTNSEFVAMATLQGMLYEVDDYPGAVESHNPNDRVVGELYRLRDSNRVFQKLDRFEGCWRGFPEPHEYIRKTVSVSLDNGDKVTVWAYIYNHDVSDLERIMTGDYAGQEK
jgi:gamma-glutamylcyclotransferase (GGCT)/AIG2-like uncharacterized protein YtfP